MSDRAYIQLEIARGRLQSIVDEAGAVLMRTAFSKTVREAKDFACALLTAEGSTVVQSSQSIPVFLGTMTNTVRAFIGSPLMAQLAPGDIIATNDPWLGTGQLFDVTIAAPIFKDGRIVAFAAVVAHVSDIGGRGFTSDAPEMYQEGLRLPIHRIATAAGIDPLVADIISANVRQPQEVLGDISAMFNAASVISTRLERLLDEMTVDGFFAISADLEHRTEAYMRRAIAGLKRGRHSASITSEGVAKIPFTISVSVEAQGDTLILDFAGTSPQVPTGINSTFTYTQSYAVYALKCLFAPDMPFNEGVLRPVRVIAPEGSVVNSSFPAAGTARSITGHLLPTVLYEALAESAPDAVIGQSGAPRPTMHFYGKNEQTQERFSALLVCAGGMGARVTGDGISCVNFPTNTEFVPIEVVEASYPVLFEEREVIPDSGGPGKFRGGLGQRVTVRCLAPRAEATCTGQWMTQSPQGVHGGGPGGRAAVLHNGVRVEVISDPIQLVQGDRLTLQTAGGGGFGPPSQRTAELVEADRRNGYTSNPTQASTPDVIAPGDGT
jgi:N-methylhydantoinase B